MACGRSLGSRDCLPYTGGYQSHQIIDVMTPLGLGPFTSSLQGKSNEAASNWLLWRKEGLRLLLLFGATGCHSRAHVAYAS